MWPERYMPGDRNHKYQLKPCEGCGLQLWIQKRRRFCSNKCAHTGPHSPVWKGDEAQYVALHERVYRRRGLASEVHHCCMCGTNEASRYEWANLTGDYTDTKDYGVMCKWCHDVFDGREEAP